MHTIPESIFVIGAGSWGSALAITLAKNVPTVKLWGRNALQMASIKKQRQNTKYLPNILFPDNILVETDFSSLLANAPLTFVIAVPSRAFYQTIEKLYQQVIATGALTSDTTIIWGTKGFAPGSGKLLSEVVTQFFGDSGVQATISGPSFATEVAAGLPTALTVACADQATANFLSTWFRNDTTRVYSSTDLVGVQLGGVVKNVLAIAAGISDGLGYGANARAALITRGLAELTRFGVALGGQPATFTGLTGVGDLILTCTDDQSRNRRFGLGIGKGRPHEQVVKAVGQEIEGIHNVCELYEISRKRNIEMPITECVYQIIVQKRNPKEEVEKLLRRAPKAEC